MKTNKWIMAGGVGMLVLLGASQLYEWRLDNRRYPQLAVKGRLEAENQESREMSPGEVVGTVLPSLESNELHTRRTALDAIAATLKEKGPQMLDEDLRERLARELIKAYSEPKEETPEIAEFKREVLKVLATRVGGKTSKEFILEVTKSTAVPEAMKPALWRHALGKKSVPEIMALFEKKDIGTDALKACAVELQNLDRPELMGSILARLDEAGALKDAKQLPWFSGRLLSQHIQKAEGVDLQRALQVVWLRPSLTKSTMKAVRGRVTHTDPSIRRMVARIIPDAVKFAGIDAQAGEELLAARLKEETDPQVKGEIEGSLAQVRNTRRPQEAGKP